MPAAADHQPPRAAAAARSVLADAHGLLIKLLNRRAAPAAPKSSPRWSSASRSAAARQQAIGRRVPLPLPPAADSSYSSEPEAHIRCAQRLEPTLRCRATRRHRRLPAAHSAPPSHANTHRCPPHALFDLGLVALPHPLAGASPALLRLVIRPFSDIGLTSLLSHQDIVGAADSDGGTRFYR